MERRRIKKAGQRERDVPQKEERFGSQERRGSEKSADVAFGPERPKADRAVSVRSPQQRRQIQHRQEQREEQSDMANMERATEGYPLDVAYSHDLPVADDHFSDVPVLDGYFPEVSVPEMSDAMPVMRGAADTPVVAPVRESEPLVIRLQNRKSGRMESNEGGTGETPRHEGQDAANTGRLQFDGERKIAPQSPQNVSARLEGDVKSLSPHLFSQRGTENKPLLNHSSDGTTANPVKYHSDTGKRLQFDAGGKQEGRPDKRTALKKQQVRQFTGESASTTAERLHFENAKPLLQVEALQGGTQNTVTNNTRLRFAPECLISEREPFFDVSGNEEEEQTGADAAEAVIDAAIILHNAVSLPQRPEKQRRETSRRRTADGGRLNFTEAGAEAEKHESGNDGRASSGSGKPRQKQHFQMVSEAVKTDTDIANTDIDTDTGNVEEMVSDSVASVPEEFVTREAVTPRPVTRQSIEQKPAMPESTGPEIITPESVKWESVRPETITPESARPETITPESVASAVETTAEAERITPKVRITPEPEETQNATETEAPRPTGKSTRGDEKGGRLQFERESISGVTDENSGRLQFERRESPDHEPPDHEKRSERPVSRKAHPASQKRKPAQKNTPRFFPRRDGTEISPSDSGETGQQEQRHPEQERHSVRHLEDTARLRFEEDEEGNGAKLDDRESDPLAPDFEKPSLNFEERSFEEQPDERGARSQKAKTVQRNLSPVSYSPDSHSFGNRPFINEETPPPPQYRIEDGRQLHAQRKKRPVQDVQRPAVRRTEDTGRLLK